MRDKDESGGTTAIEAGVSCMHCHRRGYIVNFSDVVQEGAVVNGLLRSRVQKLYDGNQLKEKLIADNDRYLRALRAAIQIYFSIHLSDSQLSDNGDPSVLVNRYLNQGLSSADIMAELGLASDNDLQDLVRHSPEEFGSLSPILRGGRVPRPTWERQFTGVANAIARLRQRDPTRTEMRKQD